MPDGWAVLRPDAAHGGTGARRWSAGPPWDFQALFAAGPGMGPARMMERIVAKPEWGVKRICPSCSTRYYDMRKTPPTCPNCGTVFDPEALLRSRRARPIPADDTKKAPVAVADDEGIAVEADDEVEETVDAVEEEDLDVADIEEDVDDKVVSEDDEDVLLEDADELGDEDDMGEVVDVEGDEDR